MSARADRRSLALTCSPGTASARAGPAAAPSTHGRLFPPQDLGLLEAPDRDIWQQPDQIMDVLGIAEASVVADIGAGSGWFTIRLARRVGPNGMVYAAGRAAGDGHRDLAARDRAKACSNVRAGARRGQRSASAARRMGKLDAILIVGVYHEIEDRVAMLRNLAEALKPQGRIGVVDFKLRRRRAGSADGRARAIRRSS